MALTVSVWTAQQCDKVYRVIHMDAAAYTAFEDHVSASGPVVYGTKSADRLRNRLGALRSYSFHIQGVQRLTGRHEEAVPLGAAETDVGADFGQMDLA